MMSGRCTANADSSRAQGATMADDGVLNSAGLLPRDHRGVGLLQGHQLSDGLSVTRMDLHYAAGADYRFASVGDFLKFHFKLSGASAISDDDEDYMPVEAGRI